MAEDEWISYSTPRCTISTHALIFSIRENLRDPRRLHSWPNLALKLMALNSPAAGSMRGTCRELLDALYQIAFRKFPVQQFLYEGFNIVGAAVLVIEIIGMFPNVNRYQGLR